MSSQDIFLTLHSSAETEYEIIFKAFHALSNEMNGVIV